MAIDSHLLNALGAELRSALIGARIDRVHQPGADEIILTCRGPAGRQRLLISAHPRWGRLVLTSAEAENPKRPPLFCTVLRKHLEGARLEAIIQPSHERILWLEAASYNEVGDPTRPRLIVELTGRLANLLLTEADGRIIDALRRLPPSDRGQRELLPGRPYAPPPPLSGIPFRESDSASAFDRLDQLPEVTLRTALLRLFVDISPVLADELLARAALSPDRTAASLTTADRQALAEAFESVAADLASPPRPTAYYEQGRLVGFYLFPLVRYARLSSRSFGSVNELLELALGVERTRAENEELVRRLQSALDTYRQRLQRRREHINADLAQARQDLECRRWGELIYSHLHLIRPGHDSVAATDYSSGQPRPAAIPLDPRLTPSENAQRYFRRYEKAKRTCQAAAYQLQATEADLGYLEQVATSLDMADSRAELTEIEDEVLRLGIIKGAPTGRPGQTPSRPLAFRSSAGNLILVGRNNRQNDRLTFQTASAGDLWFHAQGTPGAHVLLRLGGHRARPEELLEAATLAARYSKARLQRKAAVDYTQCRFVRRQPGGRPGQVFYTDFQTIIVDPEAGPAPTPVHP